MLYRSITLVVVLTSSVAHAVGGSASFLRSDVENEVNTERRLPGKGSGCPHRDEREDYYNALFELKDDEGACASCEDTDFFKMGELIREFVKDADKDFPDEVNSRTGDEGDKVTKIETEVCEMPCVWGDSGDSDTQRNRRLPETFVMERHRRLGKRRFSYKAGGRCRRCTSRRLLNEQADTRRLGGKPSAAELASEACEFTEVTKSAFTECERELDSVTSQIEAMEALAEDSETRDGRKEIMEKCSDVEEIAEKITEKMEEIVDLVEDAEKACSEAQSAVSDSDERDAKDAVRDAEESAEKAMEKAKEVHERHEEALKKLKEVKSKALEIENKRNQERTKGVIELVKEENKAKLEYLQRKIKDAEQDIKEAKSLKDAKEESRKKAKLEELKLEMEQEKKALEAAKKEYEEAVKAEAEYAKKIASILLDAEYAKDEKAWMKYYKTYLEMYVTYHLKKEYNTNTEEGCLDADKLGKFKVAVHLDEKDDEDDTLEDTCKRPGPEEPCDLACQELFPDYPAP